MSRSSASTAVSANASGGQSTTTATSGCLRSCSPAVTASRRGRSNGIQRIRLGGSDIRVRDQVLRRLVAGGALDVLGDQSCPRVERAFGEARDVGRQDDVRERVKRQPRGEGGLAA